MDLSKYYGETVRHHRVLVRLSQGELAIRAGKDRSYINGIECGRRNPTLTVLQEISDALGVDLDVMFATARSLAARQERVP
jgi:transcriptional regulator with XRE-family HTH domain